MILSMTGYGKAKGVYRGRTYTIDIKTLNGKVSELRLKAPNYLRSKEIELRKIIQSEVGRGKMDAIITSSSKDNDSDFQLNTALIENYYNQLSEVSIKLGLTGQDFLQTIIRIPSVIQASEEEISDEEWGFVQSLTKDALKELFQFRLAEGESLERDLQARSNAIAQLLADVPSHEEERNQRLKEKLTRQIEENLQKENYDPNRLEQEIVYYLEKLDIHEEKVRLKQHCEYFDSVLQEEDPTVGKKLNFISQEMGREINTLGSKAQYSSMQQVVVQMKVELDQIKEQLANIV
ncbi:MAG: hypothetical protein ACI9FN_000638 [Saprospiraceae bacterium]|jgi:uncharacterized protein (TIGR00255 family)